MEDKAYGIVELRAEHGPVVVRVLGSHDLLPGTMVEIRPVDEAPSAKLERPIMPEVRGMVFA